MKAPIIAIALASLSASMASAQTGLQGSAEAIAAAERLIESVGGHEVWTSARSLYVRERVWAPRYIGELDAHYQRDLEVPANYGRITGPTLRRESAYDATTGWVMRNDTLRILPEAEVAAEAAGWAQEPYRIYRRLARRDPGIRVALIDGDRLEVYEAATDHQLCWFVLDAGGGPLRWGNIYNGAVNEHVYGPLADFGPFRMPRWGTSTTGSWRFEYVEMRGSAEPFRIPPPPGGGG